MRYVVALIVIALFACEQSPQHEARSVKWERLDSLEAVQSRCGERFRQAYGCAFVHGNACTIVTVRPKHHDDRPTLATAGHELLHCFDGAQHT